jgi:hypothetical protein
VVALKATYLLKQNIDALLKARGQKRKDLALWCRKSESWLSQIFREDERNMPLKYLDRIADFFGLATYQLFQPGLSGMAERRKGGDRRTGFDRRMSHVAEMLKPVPAQADLEARMRRLTPEQWQRFARRADVALSVIGSQLEDRDRHDPPVEAAPPRARGARTRKPR